MMMPPGTLRATRPAISRKPRQESSTFGSATWPSPTMVAGFATTSPMPCSPMMPRKKPIPAAMPSFSESGMVLISHSRIRSTETARKMRPDRKTAPSATCQGMCMPPTTAKAK